MSELRRDQVSDEDQESAMAFLGTPRAMAAITCGSSECQGINLPRMGIRYVLLDRQVRLNILLKLGLISPVELARAHDNDVDRRAVEGRALDRSLERGKVIELSAAIDAAFDAKGAQR